MTPRISAFRFPGISLKFAPDGANTNCASKAPVSRPLLRQPEATAKAFDSDGYYRMAMPVGC